ncbi:MAG TPA: hypothetical protein VJ859_09635 [Allosphingosinicella sp.]|nr:hypothetical protein [Allosphingosinicella sp.]
MKYWRDRILLLAGVAFAGIAIPAASQRGPESLLPPGFENNESLPPRQQPPSPSDQNEGNRIVPSAAPQSGASPSTAEKPSDADLQALADLELPKPIEIPDASRRPTTTVGPLGPSNWGLAPDAFGRAHGVFLSSLMRRLDAPIPSRWASILLRRAILTRVPTPFGVQPVDWVADRAWLLLRMGEADAARLLVQSIDVDQFTPKMFAIAVQTALANADPAGLCPLVEPGRTVSDEPVWPLADAMCAALEGEPSRASALIDQARRHSGASGIDLLLAEKVIGAGENTRRAVIIEWDPVDSINSWRFGLASATGLAIPDRLLDGAGPRVRAWQARAPMLPLEERLVAADYAASLGVFSNASLVDIYSQIADRTDPSELEGSVAERLRMAYVGGDESARMTAIRQLWDDADTPVKRYARLILTAGAAARIAPSQSLANDVPRLIASMLTAGFDRQAARWSQVVGGMAGKDGDRAWAMLALASPRPLVDLGVRRIGGFQDSDDSEDHIRTRLLVAALAGLDRLSAGDRDDLGRSLGIRFDKRNRWVAMIDSAAEKHQPGTVALLAAVGMQTGDWRGVPPEYFYHIIRDLRLAGLDYEARMIAAEALSRL